MCELESFVIYKGDIIYAWAGATSGFDFTYGDINTYTNLSNKSVCIGLE